jgi:hypothetical protein
MDPRALPQSTDPRLKPSSRAFVVYDQKTGDVLHIHHAVDFGSGAPSRESHEARARRLADAAGAAAGIIEVSSDDVNHRQAKRVDVASGKILRG